jgi:NAD(P)-dependent dehydrogenase (short-subunit alcohol dehydrogenase family)
MIVRGPAEDFALEDWQRTLDMNLTSVFLLAQAAAERIPNGGSIVLLASQTSFSGGFNTAAYSASKAGSRNSRSRSRTSGRAVGSASTPSRRAGSRRR